MIENPISKRLQLLCVLLASGTMAAQADYSTDAPITVRLEQVAAGLADDIAGIDQIFPTELVAVPDGSGRMLVGTLGGIVRLLDANDDLQASPYLDTTSAVTINAENGTASFGMTTIAFHPDFASVAMPGFGRFYTVEPELTRTDPPPDFPGIGPDFGGVNPAHDRVLYEYSVDDIAADTFGGTKREVLRIHENRRGHDVNDLAFDANRYLYISSGDSGLTDVVQDLDNVFGKILRIDPLAPGDNPGSLDPISTNGKYRVPDSNPFVNDAMALAEVFAYGLRNPYRISIDPLTGQLIVTSNGESQRESVYLVDAGDNLGWPFFEGSLELSAPPAGFTFRPPLFEYDHGIGVSVNGAFVYRGSDMTDLGGAMVFADLLGAGGTGPRLFYGNLADGDFFDIEPDAGSAPTPETYVGVGENADGELYVLTTDGTVLRMRPSPDADADGVPDAQDNCTAAANPGQIDADGDGIGNACDPDINNDCAINAIDLGLFKIVFFSADPVADFNADGAVNAIDLGLMRTLFFGAPGPSGLPNACE